MSAPKIIVQIAIAGAQIFGRAFLAAGRQAVQNAKHRPEAMGGPDVAGLRNATSGSLTDRLTRDHRMTLDEAHLILNTKKEQPLESVLQHYEHLFKANSPPAAEVTPTPKTKGKPKPLPAYSHYVQSKVVRARERIEAEVHGLKSEGQQPNPSDLTPPPPSQGTPPPPPPEGGKSS
ncbi:hypothetical protein EUX98_g891 [Antrodiella citrinella]|uniref:Mitochondrial import inner membrane translocase subunit TIM16 n=1 Tax=Antrodiella citrinella TaxID=2447956 RepID=A0A4V6S1Y6_9APHY|nr:hypothetical protein EUX98_g891 [Antrodiella citrinella]